MNMAPKNVRQLGLGLAALLFLAGGVTVIPAKTSAETIRGQYEAKRDDDRIWLQLRLGHDGGNQHQFGTQIPVRAFHRRSDGQIELRREAGAFLFQDLDLAAPGKRSDKHSDKQRGDFTFEADKTYISAMAERGFRDLGNRRLFELAALDLTLNFIDSLAELGYRESLDRLVEMRIHGVDPPYIRDLASVGYSGLPSQRLVEMRIHGVDAAYAGGLKELGYKDLSAQRLVEMRIHGVNPSWLRELTELGYDELPAGRLVEMRIHGVNPSWVRELTELGYDELPASRLVEMRIHGVEPTWIREMQALGYDDEAVTAGQLVEMRIHGVDPAWVRSLDQPGLSARRLIEKRIHGG